MKMGPERTMELKAWVRVIEDARPEGIREELIEAANGDEFSAGMLAGAYFYEIYRTYGLPIGDSEQKAQ